MSLKSFVKKIIPRPLAVVIYKQLNNKRQRDFSKLPKINCDTSNLLSQDAISLDRIFKDSTTDKSWTKAQQKISEFNIPDLTGGVNPGDRRAIYYLIRNLKPKSVLEVGTHIGSSTVNIACALEDNKTENNIIGRLKTVDIRDVNDTNEKPWLLFGAKYSPLGMITKLNFQDFVNFIVGSSITFFKTKEETFDFIFLDGDHAASTVFKEVPAALKRLNPNGVILLHDYFPNGKPLWNNKPALKGPYLAIKKHINQGANFTVIPLGDLPWETKLNTNTTSLALLVKIA